MQADLSARADLGGIGSQALKPCGWLGYGSVCRSLAVPVLSLRGFLLRRFLLRHR